MLKQLKLTQFTAFGKATFDFSDGLNVIVGANGTGKTHVLKLGYLFTRAWSELSKQGVSPEGKRAEAYFEERLMGLFRPERLAHLARQGGKATTRLEANVRGEIPTVKIYMPDEDPPAGIGENLQWEISIDQDEAKIRTARLVNHAARNTILPASLFVPSKEIVSFFDGLISLFENYKINLDETYRDLAVAMTVPESQRPSELLPHLLEALSGSIGGELVLEKGKLLLRQSNGERLEPQLLAEGFRKLGMLLFLVRNHVIETGSNLFWDEPEANLNPELMRPLIEVLVALSGMGVQIVLATHSLFVLREIEILLRQPEYQSVPRACFALAPSQQGVKVSRGTSFEDVDPILTLDADLAQSGRFMDVMD